MPKNIPAKTFHDHSIGGSKHSGPIRRQYEKGAMVSSPQRTSILTPYVNKVGWYNKEYEDVLEPIVEHFAWELR